MTDHPIPDDLAEALAIATYNQGAYCGECEYDGWDECEDCQRCVRGYVPAVLKALARWADGALIDPTTWRRLTARLDEAGVDYCRKHGDLRDEDMAACGQVGECPECEGYGALETGDDSEPYVDCPLCGGCGRDQCDLAPLYTLTERAEQ